MQKSAACGADARLHAFARARRRRRWTERTRQHALRMGCQEAPLRRLPARPDPCGGEHANGRGAVSAAKHEQTQGPWSRESASECLRTPRSRRGSAAAFCNLCNHCFMRSASLEASCLSDFVETALATSPSENLLLRGHPRASWTLIPKLGRLALRTTETREVEHRLVERFKSQCLPHLQRELRDEWDVLATAQHHGLATRLLDWTSNPLVALWFTVREPPAGTESGAVCVFVPEERLCRS